ncbi:MAG: TnpV protein [Lachnospiraceae bacterium]|nr:TnpV protein [Lachnospiraceae bacterium]
MELNYTRNGDYLIPNIALRGSKGKPLRKYGRMRREFLKEHRPILYSDLSLTEQLFPHLQEIDETAHRRLDQVMEELLTKNPTPDKKTHQMEWVQHMNSLKAQAEEIIMTELVYN